MEKVEKFDLEVTESKKLVGANFPKTLDNRTYHVDTKRGEGIIKHLKCLYTSRK